MLIELYISLGDIAVGGDPSWYTCDDEDSAYDEQASECKNMEYCQTQESSGEDSETHRYLSTDTDT